MSTDNNPQASYCDGKVGMTLPIARKAAARNPGRHCNRHPYRCAKCGQWHIGSSIAPKSMRKGLKKTAAAMPEEV
jgi:hypothetical protein